MTVRVSQRTLTVGFTVVFVACVISTLGWLALGGVVALASYSGGFAEMLHTAAAGGAQWAVGVLAARPHSEPFGEALLDYGLSLVNLVLAWFLLFGGKRTWIAQLLAMAMVASAGAFNLQAHASTAAVLVTTGVDIGGIHEVLLHGVGCAAFVTALLLLPTGRWDSTQGGVTGLALAGVGVGSLMVVGFGTALLPHTISCILFFGFSAPLVGLIGLPQRTAPGSTGEQRSQTRLMFSVLLAAFGTCVALGLITAALWYLGQPGLVLVDPTAHPGMVGMGDMAGQPTALLFWFSRLSAAGIALAVLVALRRSRLWAAERLLSRGLASAMVTVLIGGGYVVVRAVMIWLPDRFSSQGSVAATALVAFALLPLYQHAQRLVDRLLYGQRPTPYSVLAEVTALAQTNPGEGPNLARAAEAIGRGLGARSCRLTVLRPGLRDRAYVWSDGPSSEEPGPDGMMVLPISQGGERIGSIAVDRGAVAGLHAERRTLLEDVADSLGAVVAASRTGIELERQLRSAVANAEDIAVSRRQAVAEMDSERRTIERDLHDGAQHHLVTLRLALGLVEHEVASGQLPQARERLAQLLEQVDTAEEILAKTASGVSSIVLSEQGLAAALRADLGQGQSPVTLSISDEVTARRLHPAAEVAVYFCCLESVNNARKHAPGAPVTVYVECSDGELRFRVRDEGPGFDPASVAGVGRGRRNLTARILAVGGAIEVDSAPGAGTTVSGTVPLPASAGPDVPPGAGVVPGPPQRIRERLGADPGGLLVDNANELLASARRVYLDGPERARLDDLERRLTEPLRVVLAGSRGAGVSTLCRALESSRLPANLRVVDGSHSEGAGSPRGSAAADQADTAARTTTAAGGDDPAPDVLMLVLMGPGDDDPGLFADEPGGYRIGLAPVVGVLSRADEFAEFAPDTMKQATQASEVYWTEPPVRRTCQHMLVASGLLGLAGATLSEPEFEQLRTLATDTAGTPDAVPWERLGEFGVHLAVELIRDGTVATREQLADELVQHSGLAELRTLLGSRLSDLATALRVHTTVTALEQLAHSDRRSTEHLQELLYQLEQFRAGAHDLMEIGLVDAIRSGRLRLPGPERQSAEQLLGMTGDVLVRRLGLPIDADNAAIHDAARHQHAHWQRVAGHPTSTSAVRELAELLVKTCEVLLTRAEAVPTADVPAVMADFAGSGGGR